MLTKSFKLTLVAIIILIIIIVIGIFLRQRQGSNQTTNDSTSAVSLDKNQLKQNQEVMQPGQENQTTIFASPNGFSFYYPKTFKVGQFEEGDGDMVLLQSLQDSSPYEGGARGGYSALSVQIFTKDFNDPGPITAERIQKELPDVKMVQSQTATLDGAQAVTFTDTSGLYNVWVIYNKKLFQISGYSQEKDFINQILNTWKWQELN